MIKYLLVLALAVSQTFGAVTRIGQAANQFNPALSGSWVYISDTDTPEGSYVIPFTSVSSISASSLLLGTTIPAGTPVKIFVKVLDYDQTHNYTATIGGATTASESFDDRDVNTIYWTLGKVVTTVSDATTISFTFNRSAVHDARFFGFYLTTDTNEVVFRDDKALSYRYPTTAETDAVVSTTQNFIPNSSFECGLGPYWRPVVGSGNSRTNSLADMWSTAQARTGTRSLAIPVPATGGGRYMMHSLPFDIGSNKVGTASMYVRSSGANVTANIGVKSIYPTPTSFTDVLTIKTSSTATSAGWSRVAVTWTNLYYPNGQYFIEIETQGISTAADCYVDDLQVVQGNTATTWAPMYDFEFDLRPSEQSQIFWTSDSPTIEVRAFNNSAGALTRTINYEIFNRTNGISVSNSVGIAVNAGTASTATINVSTTEKGHFRIYGWLTNQNSDTELTYLVIKQPSTLTVDTNSYFGSHIDHSDSALYRAQRLGVKWHRTLSTGRLRWSEIELTEGAYTYPSMNRYTNYGVTILGTIGEDSPSWLTPKTEIINKIGRYTTNLVSQYPWIKYWEFWNEPDQDSTEISSMTDYGDVLDVVAPLIDTWSSGSFIGGGGGVLTPTQIISQLAAMTETNRIDFFTVHEYSPNESVAPTAKTQILDVYGRPIWNSESGVTDKGSYTGPRFPFPYAGIFVFPWKSADLWYDSYYGNLYQITRNFITAVAYGQTKMFYYDIGQRNLEMGDMVSRQFTMVDYDDSMRVKAAALRGLWDLLDGADGRGFVSNDAGMSAYAFVNGSTNIVAFWTTTNSSIALSGVSASNLRIYDEVGNVSTPSTTTINSTRMPQYCVGYNGMTLSTLTNAFGSGSRSGRADILAPNLLLTAVPRVSGAHWRWLAIDDSDVPYESSQTAIEYRYSIDGGAYSSWGGDTFVNQTGASIIVQARDLAGNIATASFNTSGGSPTSPTGGGKLQGKSKLNGKSILR